MLYPVRWIHKANSVIWTVFNTDSTGDRAPNRTGIILEFLEFSSNFH